mgnify:CR=1 FL=1
MAHRYVITERVQFSETDMAGIVHFSNFFRYMERVEHAFFRSLGFSIWEGHAADQDEGDRVAWPRVHASCDFKAPLRFEEEVDIELLVEELRTRTIRYLIRCWKKDGRLAAEGRMVVACVRRNGEGQLKATEIPERFRGQIESAPEEAMVLPDRPVA